MSLVHNKVVVTPDQPGFEVDATEYNAEHKFPGAGAGEIVFVDASGHAATTPDFTYTTATNTLKFPAVGGVPVTITTAYGGDPMTPPSIPHFAFSFGDTVGGLIVTVPDGNFNAGQIQFGPLPTPENDKYCIVPFNSTGLKWDLGANDPDKMFRTGYFGTSVVSPLFTGGLTGNVTGNVTGNLSGNVSADPMGSGVVDSASYSVGGNAGQSGTVSGADLVAQSLSFVNGIYMGLV